MARTKFILLSFIGVAVGISACAPSPLYVRSSRIGTVGEIPRDGRGEPIWGAIRQPPPSSDAPVMPPRAGIPITPPPGY
ncbi:MAG: hypothetical protein ACOYLS_09585 [Polymorphobacter sp.]